MYRLGSYTFLSLFQNDEFEKSIKVPVGTISKQIPGIYHLKSKTWQETDEFIIEKYNPKQKINSEQSLKQNLKQNVKQNVKQNLKQKITPKQNLIRLINSKLPKMPLIRKTIINQRLSAMPLNRVQMIHRKINLNN